MNSSGQYCVSAILSDTLLSVALQTVSCLRFGLLIVSNFSSLLSGEKVMHVKLGLLMFLQSNSFQCKQDPAELDLAGS